MAPTSALGKIVVGVDGSDASMHALDWAAAEAGRRRLPLYVVHVLDVPRARRSALRAELQSSTSATMVAARELIESAVRHTQETWPTVTQDHLLEVGNPTQVLLEMAEHAYELVVGSRGRGGFASLLLGSVSSAVAEHAACPVIVVRAPSPDAREQPYSPYAGTVVVGVDGSATSLAAVEFAFEEASFLSVHLTVLHVSWDPWLESSGAVSLLSHQERVSMTDEERVGVAETLAGMRERFPDVSIREVDLNGRPAEQLVNASAGARLLVVGGRGLGGFAGVLLGSVSRAVLQHAHCPVAVVRPVASKAP